MIARSALRPFALATLAGSLTLVAPVAHAGLLPEVVAAIGGTGAVEGEPNNGGVGLALSLLWPFEDHFRTGVMGFADDLGQRTDRLVSPSGADLGPIQSLHRQASGVAWRIEAQLPGKRYEPFAILTWGVYRFTDDLRGVPVNARTASGVGLGLGLARRFSDRHAAGASVRYQQLTRGAVDRYLSAAFEWRWRIGAGR